MERVVLTVGGMSCGHCKSSVEKALTNLSGVEEVTVNLAEKKVVVEYESSQIDLEKIKAVIVDEGYEVMN